MLSEAAASHDDEGMETCGLRFIRLSAVDKRLKVGDLRWKRVDVVVLTGVIGFFVAGSAPRSSCCPAHPWSRCSS